MEAVDPYVPKANPKNFRISAAVAWAGKKVG